MIVASTALLVAGLGIYYALGYNPQMRHSAHSNTSATAPQQATPRTFRSFAAPRGLRIGVSVPTWTTLATLHVPVLGYSEPSTLGRARFVGSSWTSPLTVPVLARHDNWLKVPLIGRPNGQTTWILANDVSLTRTPYCIVVDLSRKRLLLFEKRKLRLYAPAGIGTSQTPTPSGDYFVAFFAQSPNPSYGPFVIVTSGFSKTVSDWEEDGTPVITLNGPRGSDRQIASGGASISPGSVRLLDEDLERLRSVPNGTPVNVEPTISPKRSRQGKSATS